jgi:hypothetical protein
VLATRPQQSTCLPQTLRLVLRVAHCVRQAACRMCLGLRYTCLCAAVCSSFGACLHGQRGKHSANTQDSSNPASAPTFCRSSGSSRSFSFTAGSFVYQPALVGHINANLPKEKGTSCLLAAQLCGSTRPGAVAWPGGRAASCFPVGVCQGAGHVMAPGRVSRYAVRPATVSRPHVSTARPARFRITE